MCVRKENNRIVIGKKEIYFKNSIDTILKFPDYCIVLLMDDVIPDNNIEAYDYGGNRVWNISQIIKFDYSESYVSLSKEAENLFSVITYGGVKFLIDATTYKIVNKSITK